MFLLTPVVTVNAAKGDNPLYKCSNGLIDVGTWFEYNVSYLFRGEQTTDHIVVEITNMNATHVWTNWTGVLIVYASILRDITFTYNVTVGVIPPFWMNTSYYVDFLASVNFSITLTSEYTNETYTGPEIYIHEVNESYIDLTVIDYALIYPGPSYKTILETQIKIGDYDIIIEWTANYTLVYLNSTSNIKTTEESKLEIGKLIRWAHMEEETEPVTEEPTEETVEEEQVEEIPVKPTIPLLYWLLVGIVVATMVVAAWWKHSLHFNLEDY